jgi:hypothetical protein
LSIVVTHGRAAERLDALRAGNAQLVADADDAADALYVNDVLPEGTAVFIAHLDLRVADTLAEITLVGRVGPDASHDILRRVGERGWRHPSEPDRSRRTQRAGRPTRGGRSSSFDGGTRYVTHDPSTLRASWAYRALTQSGERCTLVGHSRRSPRSP